MYDTASVSVIIPNFNRALLIGETLENILSQSHHPVEIIVVDDGSTDNSVDVIKGFGEKVILIQQPNQGPAAARNKGLRIAKGDFIQFMDSDDLFSRNKLEAQVKILTRTNSDIAFSPWAKVRLEHGKAILEDHILQNEMPDVGVSLLSWHLRGWSTVFQTFLMRSALIKRAGEYREDMRTSEDIEYLVRILLMKPRIAFTDECLTLYRLHDFDKISGGGTTVEKRIIDHCTYLNYTSKNLAQAGYKADPYTRVCFKSEILKSIKELKAIHSCPPDLIKSLERLVSRSQTPFLNLFLFYLRAVVFVRKRTRGSYWRGFYKSDYPTKLQRELIQDLGFLMV